MVIMKNIIKNIFVAFSALVAFTACNDDNVSDLRLDGDCAVTALSADDYEGVIDATEKTITVRVPETYATESMTITRLDVSVGAESSIRQGDVFNLSMPQTMHVTNGDVYMDWTIITKRDEAKILSFKLNDTYTGIINEDDKTISVFVPDNLDLKTLVPTIVCSDNAEISPMSGVATDFTQPVQYTVTNNTAQSIYTVTVTAIGKPEAIYVGLASSMEQLNPEEQAACKWMLANIPNSLYASFADIKAGTVDISECKVMWWHFHKDGGVDGKAAFELAAPEAVDAAVKLRDYYNNGGSFLFTRYATNMPAFLGAVANEGCPNNCWGQNESDAETVSGPWSFFIQGHTDHALYQNLLMNSSEPNAVYTCDAGYRITNSTAQWHIGSDWGGYPTTADWRTQTGGIDLGYGGDGAIVAWEFPANGTRGGILCIGSGCYDWYSVDDVTEHYHANVATMTQNAFNYLMNK